MPKNKIALECKCQILITNAFSTLCQINMDRYTIQQRLEIIRIYHQNACSVRRTFRALREIYGQHNRPTERSLYRLVQKFEQTGSVADKSTFVRRRGARSEVNIAAVSQSVGDDPNLSIPRRSQELGLSQTTTWRILHQDLRLKAYKVQITQELKPNDHQVRRNFANWALEQLEADPHFAEKIIFSDEAHFCLNGFVNKHNCRIWADENPQVIHESPLYPEKVTVWCGFWAQGVIGPYFFEDDDGNRVTVNGERYRNMLVEYLWPELRNGDINNVFFQQDGATCHTSRETIDLLQQHFPGRVISRNANVNWPPRSCDLTPLDFFLWGHVKSLVYKNKPRTIPDLKRNIERTIRNIPRDMCERVVANWASRMHSVRRSRGGHLNDIIFKT